MKKIVCLFVALASLLFSVYSQSVDRDYFRNNILDLDPIEGIYDAQVFGRSALAWRWQESSEKFMMSTTVVIFRSGQNRFEINDINNLQYADNVYIERIGESNAYNFYKYWSAIGWVKNRVVLNNANQFEFICEVPEAQMRYDNDKFYREGLRIVYRIDCIKEYPTQSLYDDAIRMEQTEPSEWSGTGFALNDGYIVTNYHVVENANTITIQGIKGDFGLVYKASIAAIDKVNDLALLKITDNGFSGFGTITYKVKAATSEVGEDVFVLGYPLTSTMGDEIKLTTGIISSKTGFQGDVSMYQISAPIQPGNSGGPLFDSKGNVIGVINAKHIGTENVSYAIKTSYLMNLVESTMSSAILPSANTISGLPLTGKVKSVKSFVFMIKCSNNNEMKQETSKDEPGNNLNKSVAQIKAMFPDISFLGETDFGKGYGCGNEGTHYYWWFKDDHCIKESMVIEPNSPNDDFPETFYEQLIESFNRSNYKSVTRNILGHLFEYSYFTIQIQCHNSKTSIIYQLK